MKGYKVQFNAPGKNSKKLIIFFNGWSLDKNIVKHLNSFEYDVLMFYDYENLDVPEELLTECNNYEEVNIIAWSFGVWAFSSVINQFKNLKHVIAINGTPVPIDDSFGIPERIFNLTLSNLSEKNYPIFYRNMFESWEENFLNGMPERNIENQRQELIQIQHLASMKNFAENVRFFNKIFIGIKDKIIPAKNQIKFWSQKKDLPVFKLNEGHCVFNLFKSWDEIIDYE